MCKTGTNAITNVPITNIGHTAFYVKNMNEMLNFYVNVLGMEKLFTITTDESKETIKGTTEEELSKLNVFEKIGNRPWIEYLKLADGQYIELFHDLFGPKKSFDDRSNYYGYKKLNFEVDNILEIREILVNAGVKIDDDVHKVVDGSLEIAVHDPDGNEVQFVEYAKNGKIPLTEKANHKVYSHVNYITQVAYNVKDSLNMRNFYTKGLGLKLAKTLKYSDLIEHLLANGTDLDEIKQFNLLENESWIDFIEVAPHQYIELFYNLGESKQDERKLSNYYGYQHLCLEVSDIHIARDAILKNGLMIDKDITLGADYSYQLWVVDPDGNRIELMQYTDKSKQSK